MPEIGARVQSGGEAKHMRTCFAYSGERLLGMFHERFSKFLALMVRVDAEIIDFGPMTIVADHGRGDDKVTDFVNNEPLGIDLHLSYDVLGRVVDGVDESAVMPEFDNGIEVGVLIWSDCEHE